MRVLSESRLSDVLHRLPGVPRVVVSGNLATPGTALALLDSAVAEYQLFALNAHLSMPDRAGVSLETPFVGPAMRGRASLRYFPCRLSLVPALLARTLPPDVALLHTSTPHEGTVSLGTEVNILPAAIDAVRSRGGLVIAQLNPHMPYTFGDSVITVDDIDFAIEVEEPLPNPQVRPADDTSRLIGEHVAGLVPDGATLQLGIGAVPDAALAALPRRQALRVWSEMISDGVLDLHKAGALNTDVPISASFLFGSQELYDWVDHNPRMRLLRTEKTNDPALIAKQPSLISINTALQVDLAGQANASWARGAIYSGFGGQTDFVVGALHSAQGKAIIALPSWHAQTDTSTVVSALNVPVTSFQHSFVVSENGVGAIWGRDATDQAQQIIDNVASPRARAGLRQAGLGRGLRLR